MAQPKGARLVFNLLLQKSLNRTKEMTGGESAQWCSGLAISSAEAIKKVLGQSYSIKDPSVDFPEEYAFARRKVESSPHKMGGAANMLLLYNICKQKGVSTILETGVAYGWSSLAILLAIRERSSAALFSTDMPYAKMGNENSVGIVVPDNMKSNWYLFRESDISGLPKILKRVRYFDVIHYDSDKSFTGRMWSYSKLYDRLRSGGVFISDDIQDNIAFKLFVQKRKLDPIIVAQEGKYSGIVVKP